MQNATFLKLDRIKMAKAINRCKTIHPKARRTSRTTVEVRGSRGDVYTVTLAQPKPDLALAMCNCPAGQAGQACYHIVAAASVPFTIFTESRAEQSAPTGAPHHDNAAERDSTPPSFAAWNARPSWRRLANQVRAEQPKSDVLAHAGLNWMVANRSGVA